MKPNARTFELAVLCAFALTLLCAVARFDRDCHSIEQSVLRLHVIANSDSAEDQALKLKVRDALLQKGTDLFSGGETKSQAQQALAARLPLLQKTAQDAVYAAGRNDAVTVTLSQSAFPTRTYGDVTLPAGIYDALRVVIGRGEGKNWWCVMFPPLCLPAAKADEIAEDVLNDGALFTAKQSPRYEPRFWIIEKLRDWGL